MTSRKLRIFSWGLYDFANTIFSMNVVSLYFALWVVKDMGGTDLMVGASRAAAMLFVAMTMPLGGAIADRFGLRMPLVALFTLLCCLATAGIGIAPDLTLGLLFFALAVYAYQAALVFYNALLPEVAEGKNLGGVSGLGVSLGYLGSIAGMLMVKPFVGSGENFSRQDAFLPTAALFLLFSLPFFLFVRDSHRLPIENLWEKAKEAWGKLKVALTRAEAYPGVRRFLLGRFFIIDAMETIIGFMSLYLVEVGSFSQEKSLLFGLDEVLLFFVISTTFAVAGAYFWGIGVNRFGPKKVLLGVVLLWLFTLLLATVSPRGGFWIVGPLAGLCIGGIWTSDRPLLIGLVRDEKVMAEFFGLYALSGRLAAVVGPLMWGVVIELGKPLGSLKYRLAAASVLSMMFLGYLILRKVPDVNERLA
jgi:UMF1 family MFS transporter